MTPTQLQIHEAHKARQYRPGGMRWRPEPKPRPVVEVAEVKAVPPVVIEIQEPDAAALRARIAELEAEAKADAMFKIKTIQRFVAKKYNVSRADILSIRRTINLVRPRQVAMYLAKKLTLKSLPEIGRGFGDRDHTTVMHAIRKIERLCETVPGMDATIMYFKSELAGRLS